MIRVDGGYWNCFCEVARLLLDDGTWVWKFLVEEEERIVEIEATDI